MAGERIERYIPWPRERRWRPGEPLTIAGDEGETVTYLLRGVMRDTDPSSEFATVTLEPVRTIAREDDLDELSAAG